MRNKTFNLRHMVMLGMLSALAYIVMVFGRIPVVLFLKYDPKDVIITIGGFIYGPLSSLLISIVVSFVEMFTVSDTGFIGLLMNIISTCSFACTAAFIYKKKHTMLGAAIGLIAATLLTTVIMLLWNYLITPLYMDAPREDVVKLLVPAFLPFNLLKGGLNTGITMLLYKPVSRILRKTRVIASSSSGAGSNFKKSIGTAIASIFVIITCVLFIFVLQGKI